MSGTRSLRAMLVVPGKHVVAIVQALLYEYDVKAESVHMATRELPEGTGWLGALWQKRNELLAVDDALDQLDWTLAEREEPVEISAARWVLSDAVHGALTDAIETLYQQCEDYPRGRCDVPDLEETVDRIEELLRLFRVTELVEPPDRATGAEGRA